MNSSYNLDSAIRKIPDFPKKGILFYDITSILMNPEAFRYCITTICSRADTKDLSAVAAVEARGFIFGAPVAEKLDLPLILVRKKGKLPGNTAEKEFSLEYGTDVIQVQKDDIKKGGSVLLIDDLVATGGTLKAAAELITECGGSIREIFCIIGLPFLNGFVPLKNYTLKTLITYTHEKI